MALALGADRLADLLADALDVGEVGEPLGCGGVPTLMRDAVLLLMASATSVVALSSLREDARARRSPSPGSTIGERPAASVATLSALTSTPMMW